jgi:hypothetical protein
MRMSRKTAALLAAVASLAVAGVSIAADGATTVTVDPATTLMPGATAPFDAPGVRAVRRGKPIPAGYRLIGQHVKIVRGRQAAGAALRFSCPGATRLRTFGVTGMIGAAVTDGGADYVGRRSAWLRTFEVRGRGADGTVYAVCR